MDFGKRLRLLRLQHKFSQNDLAKEFKISSATLSQYENGKRLPDLNTVIKIANFFNVSIDYLVCRTDYNYKIDNGEIYESKFNKDIMEILGYKNIELIYKLKNLEPDEKALIQDILEFIMFRRK